MCDSSFFFTRKLFGLAMETVYLFNGSIHCANISAVNCLWKLLSLVVRAFIHFFMNIGLDSVDNEILYLKPMEEILPSKVYS